MQTDSFNEIITVVLVEDEPNTRDYLSSLIEGNSKLHLLASFDTANAALHFLALQSCDVLLVDLGLPDRSGLDVISFASGAHPNCDIMVITVFGDESHVLKSIAAGATGYLIKESSASELLHHIETLRAGGSPISPVIARQLLTKMRPAQQAPASANSRKLSEQEIKVLNYIAKGFAVAEIGELMKLSAHTISTYVKRIYRKLSVNSKTEAVFEGGLLGLIEQPRKD
ncbi:MAG: response regulator transcription factor [Burkholderiales bacterium]|jgi:DNA-binding NarL/FixJ family response regulator|nr:response regulator transcription factor [Burkholderiales bacterium]